jgi:ABC-type multidrug transport system permease subunit
LFLCAASVPVQFVCPLFWYAGVVVPPFLCVAWSQLLVVYPRDALYLCQPLPTATYANRWPSFLKYLYTWSKFSSTLVLFAHLFLQINPHSILAIVLESILLKGQFYKISAYSLELVKGTMCRNWCLNLCIFLGWSRPKRAPAAEPHPWFEYANWLQLGIYVVL